VIQLAGELGLGVGDIAEDTTHVNIYSKNDTYLDLLKKLSDYWTSGATVKKDFYVDVDNDLAWKARGTAGTETLTVGENVNNYHILRDVESVKNNITVYGYQGKIGVPGHEGRCDPANKDTWTYGTGWTDDWGTISLCDTDFKVGTDSLQVLSEDTGAIFASKIRRTVNEQIYGDAAYQTLNLYSRRWGVNNISTHEARLYAPDSSNYFYTALEKDSDQWVWQQFQLGENQEYDADTNPNGKWLKNGGGSPNWSLITELCLYAEHAADQFTVRYDSLFFGHGKFRYTASDLPGSYGQRDYQTVDDSLMSDAECEARAKTLLYQLKDPPVRIDIETEGNAKIKIADQLTMTIPAEDISAQPYDVLSVEHDFQKKPQGWKTKASMVNSSNIRRLPIGTPLEAVTRKFGVQHDIGKGIIIIQ
jgi:hypothetical protein